MSEMSSFRLERASSAKVAPVKRETFTDEHWVQIVTISSENSEQSDITNMEKNDEDSWLPITESRKGSIFSATFHLLCSGIGVQAMALPLAFASLGWLWGILVLSVAFSWQLYTIWLLVNLHESPQGTRYSRYVHLSIVAFGEKLGKLLAIFPTMYLSGGTCVMYIINGGGTLKSFYNIMCDNNCHGTNSLTLAEWFLVFICLAILLALFFPNLNSLSRVSFVGSVTAITYCMMIWILVVRTRRLDGTSHDVLGVEVDSAAKVRDVLNGLGIILLAFRGHNVVLEIQGTLPNNPKYPSTKPMWRGVMISYLLIMICLYPLAIVGYWAYGDMIPSNGGLVNAYLKFHQNDTSKYVIGTMYLIMVINYLCAFQIYAMPVFDNLERIFAGTKNKPCTRLIRSSIRLFFGGLTYFISMAFPFLPSLGPFIGSIALPVTFAYPCFMWITMKRPGRSSTMRWINLGLGSLGIVLSVVLVSTALWALIANGLKANFLKPR